MAVDRLRHTPQRLLSPLEIQARLRSLGLTPTGTPANVVVSGMASDYAYWGKLINELGIKVE